MRIARVPLLALLLLMGQVMGASATAPAPGAPTRSAFSLDGVAVTVSSAFVPGAQFTAAASDDAIQAASATTTGGDRELSVLAVPFGTRPGSEALPAAGPGAESTYRTALAQQRSAAGARTRPGPVAKLFGSLSEGILSQPRLRLGAAGPRPALLVEWVVNSGSRTWLVRAAAATASAGAQRRALAALAGLEVGGDSAAPRPARFARRPAASNATNVVPAPWWSGPCDSGNYAGAYALGADVDGIQACGPRPIAGGSDRLVRFYSGAWGELEWECVEFSMRYMYMMYGIAPYGANGSQVVWNYPGTQMSKVANPTPGIPPLPGDVLSYGATSTFGHTSVVASSAIDGSGNGTIGVVEENNSATGAQTLQVSGWQVMSGLNVTGWLHRDGRLEALAVGPGHDLGNIRQASAGGGWSAWSTVGGTRLDGTPAVVRNGDGRNEVFLRDPSGAVVHLWQGVPGGPFGNAYSLTQVVTGNVAAGTNVDGRLAVFGIGPDHAMLTSSQVAPGGGWSAWTSLGGDLVGDPAVGHNPDGRLELFSRDAGGSIWHAWQVAVNAGFSPWARLPADGAGALAVASNSDGTEELFGLAADGSMAHARQQPSGSWSTWTSLGGYFSSPPSVGTNQDGRLELFARDSTGRLQHTWETSPSGPWAASFYSLGDLNTTGPKFAAAPGPGRGTVRMYPMVSPSRGAPAAGRNADGRIEVVIAGSAGDLLHLWQTSPGGGWSAPYSLGGKIEGNPAIFTD